MDSNYRVGAILEGKVAITNNYAITASASASSGKNMHRQV